MQQYSRRWNIEVCNIPEDIVQDQLKPNIMNALGQMKVDTSGRDIEIVHRLRKKRNSMEPATVTVRFKDRNNEFKAMKKKKNTKNVDKKTTSQSLMKNMSEV